MTVMERVLGYLFWLVLAGLVVGVSVAGAGMLGISPWWGVGAGLLLATLLKVTSHSEGTTKITLLGPGRDEREVYPRRHEDVIWVDDRVLDQPHLRQHQNEQ